MEPGDTPLAGGAMTLLLAGVWANQALGLAKPSCENPNQADLHSSKFSGQSPPPVWFCRKAKTLVEITIGPCWCEFWPKIHVLVVASPFPLLRQSDSQSLNPMVSPAIPGMKRPTMLSELVVLRGLFLFPLEKPDY